jgi:hypothetical protein
MVPAETRLPDARRLIEEGGYFVVHAPRQTGKTTTLRTLARSLTHAGDHAALWFTCETGEPSATTSRSPSSSSWRCSGNKHPSICRRI